MIEWISVKDRLPDSETIIGEFGRRIKDILLHWQFGEFGGEYHGWYADGKFWKTTDGKIKEVFPVTHYIKIKPPIPYYVTPPKEDE